MPLKWGYLGLDPHPLHAALEVLGRESLDSYVLLSLDLSQDVVATEKKQQNGMEELQWWEPNVKIIAHFPQWLWKNAFLVSYNLIVGFVFEFMYRLLAVV